MATRKRKVGRPKKAPTKSVGIRLTIEQFDRLSGEAEALGRTLPGHIRFLVTQKAA